MTLVAGSNRKMDKSTVLQATISFLKRNKEMSAQTSQQKEVTEQWKPPYISNAEFSQLMLESLDGFLIAICKSGQVIYVSENITPVLGHTPETMMNESFFQFVHDAERSDIFAKLSQGQAQESSQNHMLNNVEPFPVPQGLESSEVQFSCHLRRGNPEMDLSNDFEHCILKGTFRRFTQNTFCGLNSLVDVNTEDNTCFVGICRLSSPLYIKDLAITDKNASEFSVRLSLEGKFVHVEGKSCSALGYSSLELLGKSYFDLVHVDDLEKIEESFGKLLQCGELQAPLYRLMTKGRQWLWVQPRLYVQYHQWSRKAESINVTHFVVTYQDVLAHLSKERKRRERERQEMELAESKTVSTSSAVQNGQIKFEIKDMQLPAITIDSVGEKVSIPKIGEESNETPEEQLKKIQDESKEKESRLMNVIQQYEDELKRVKEELNIYQRRDKTIAMNPIPKPDNGHPKVSIPHKVEQPGPARLPHPSVLQQMQQHANAQINPLMGQLPFGLASMPNALKTSMGIPIPNLNSFQPGQNPLAGMNLQGLGALGPRPAHFSEHARRQPNAAELAFFQQQQQNQHPHHPHQPPQ